jgi:hypothetical protein
MPVEGLRSPHSKLAGLYHLGRMLDKIRLHQRGQLPERYHRNLGLSLGLDGHLCGFLGIDFAELTARVAQGGSDEELAEWCFARGLRPNKMQTRIWNEFSRKFGWDDLATRFLEKTRQEDGLEHRTDLVTAFALIDHAEGHLRPTDA